MQGSKKDNEQKEVDKNKKELTEEERKKFIRECVGADPFLLLEVYRRSNKK